jgi:hypothetical protein
MSPGATTKKKGNNAQLPSPWRQPGIAIILMWRGSCLGMFIGSAILIGLVLTVLQAPATDQVVRGVFVAAGAITLVWGVARVRR